MLRRNYVSLPGGDPFRRQLYAFLHDAKSPIRYLQHQLGIAPLIPGTGEFGGGCDIPGLHHNIVGNNLAVYALLAGASMEEQAGDRATAVTLRQEAQRLRDNIERYLVAVDRVRQSGYLSSRLKGLPDNA